MVYAFAVCDWVEANQKLHEESTEIESKTLEQFLSEIKAKQVALKEQSKLLDEWRAHEIDLKNPSKDDKGALGAAIFFSRCGNQRIMENYAIFFQITQMTVREKWQEKRAIFILNAF